MRTRNATNIATSVSCVVPSAAPSVRRQCLHTAAKSYCQGSDDSQLIAGIGGTIRDYSKQLAVAVM